MSEEIFNKLYEAKVGGAFIFPKKDNELYIRYQFNKKVCYLINMDFGSIDNFRKSYTKYIIDLSNAKNTEQRQQVISENETITKYITEYKLPLVHNFDLCGRPSYIRLYNKISSNSSPSLVFGPKFHQSINTALTSLSPEEKIIIRLYYGLDTNQPLEISDISIILGKSQSQISIVKNRSLHKLALYFHNTEIIHDLYKPTSKFIKEYFQLHDIFYDEKEPNLKKSDINKLISLCPEHSTFVQSEGIQSRYTQLLQQKKIIKLTDQIPLINLKLPKTIYNILLNYEITNLTQLLELMQVKDFYLGLDKIGPKSAKKIEHNVHQILLKILSMVDEKDLDIQNFNLNGDTSNNTTTKNALPNSVVNLRKRITLLTKQIEDMTNELAKLSKKPLTSDVKYAIRRIKIKLQQFIQKRNKLINQINSIPLENKSER